MIIFFLIFSDPKLISQYPDSTKDSTFEWHSKLKGNICKDKCTYKLNPTSLEIKLKKVTDEKWSSLAPLSLDNEG